MEDDPRLWAAIRKAVELKLLPASCVQDDYLQNIEKIRRVLAAADEATENEPLPGTQEFHEKLLSVATPLTLADYDDDAPEPSCSSDLP
jgi:hypothetical protein